MASVNRSQREESREVPLKLHGYFRSSAAYRVRIALNIKGLTAEHLPHHLRKGEQTAPDYLALNPQGLVPTLEDDAGAILTQSLAIIEWLDETHPTPPLLPLDALQRAKARAVAQAIACDIHPVQNLKVLARLRQHGLPEEKVTEWAAWANREGLAACEKLIAEEAGPVLLRRGADHRRSLPGAAACQCAALRRRRVGLSAAAAGRSRLQSHAGICRRSTGPAARCRVSPTPSPWTRSMPRPAICSGGCSRSRWRCSSRSARRST